jgi:hypothetical protein
MTESPEEQFLKQLTEKEYKAYLIAKEHLGSLFRLEQTTGFVKWKQKNEK